MLSKCANPECAETFRYLHEGKLFYLATTPETETAMAMESPEVRERFWLCAQCSKQMTLVWGGTEVKVVPLAATAVVVRPALATRDEVGGRRRKARSASAGREDR